jgi:aerobic-type carbon monoxide dehydrogenase small subunit (CoxS/CutS family)
MKYSRRNFMKAAGIGTVAISTNVGVTVAGAATAPANVPTAMSKETSGFNINGKVYQAEYEARTTLWEVIAVKLGLTGTNRSCNRASCGCCKVTAKGLLDKNPNPNVEDVKAALSGHLCRCGAYESIIHTVIDTGKVLRGEAEIV